VEDNRQQILKKWIDLINPNEDGTQAIYAAMAEYAKQESVAFTKWVDDEKYYWGLDNMWTSVNDTEPRNDEQLYSLYQSK